MAWSFDPRTAILVGALVTWLTAGMLLLNWKSLPGNVRPSLRWWLAGIALHPVGFALIGLGDLLPDWIAIAVGVTLLAASFSCMAIALRSFYGLPERRLRLSAITVLVGVAAIWFTFVSPHLQVRIILVHVLLAMLIGSGARAVFRRGGPRGRVPRITGALFALVTVLVLMRAGLEGFWPIAPDQLLSATPVNLACIGGLLLLPVLATVGFLLMCAESAQVQLERMARVDYLTGIYNRRAIDDLATRAISAARRHGTPLAIVIVDVDHFKRVNDEHGHECGDNVLVEVVRRMRGILRSEDLIGRQGGEEFVVVMPDIDIDSAQAAAERLRRGFSDAPMAVHDGDGPVELVLTISIGVAALERTDQQFSHLLRRADRAMYAAKTEGRNRVKVAEGPMPQALR
ncbi:MAG: diguanylate cyclase [Gammaproteobacteria bacterium]|nr:diguanylate cyclase [Gammaproteobacteria bacterium]